MTVGRCVCQESWPGKTAARSIGEAFPVKSCPVQPAMRLEREIRELTGKYKTHTLVQAGGAFISCGVEYRQIPSMRQSQPLRLAQQRTGDAASAMTHPCLILVI